MTNTRFKPIYVALAAALLGMVVLPIAFAGAASNPQAQSSASVKKQLKKLKQRIAQLEGQGGPNVPDALPPNGPAGGDLTGQYPNPLIAPNAVGTTELEDNAVATEKIAPDAVNTVDLANDAVNNDKIAANAVNAAKIANGTVGGDEIASNSVGSDQLKGVYENATGFNAIAAGTSTRIDVFCDAGDRSIGWGATWDTADADVAVSEAFRLPGTPNGYTVRGNNTDGATHSISVRVLCLDV